MTREQRIDAAVRLAVRLGRVGSNFFDDMRFLERRGELKNHFETCSSCRSVQRFVASELVGLNVSG